MRLTWLAFAVLLCGCFDPTQQSPGPDPSGTGSESGDPTGDPTTATTATTASTSTSATTATTTSDPSTTTDPTTAETVDPETTADPSTTGESTTDPSGTESSTTGTSCSTGLPCLDDAECSPGTCVDLCCVAPPDYGPCDACEANEVEAELTGIAGCFCAPPCDDGMQCPPGPDGSATASCSIGGDMGKVEYCALLCDPAVMDECPLGMTCAEVPDMPGVGVCTHP